MLAGLGLVAAAPCWAQLDPSLMGPDMLGLLRGRQRLDEHRQALERDPDSPTLGPGGASVTLVQLFDYRCPTCRDLAPLLVQLQAADGDLRIVFKEWPIFGGVSVDAARTALAAHLQGRYLPVHERLMAMRGLTPASVREVAVAAGCDPDRLGADRSGPVVERQLTATAQIALALGFRGTPTLVIGRRVIPGAVPRDRLETLIELARRNA